jgi:hypothetical protein
MIFALPFCAGDLTFSNASFIGVVKLDLISHKSIVPYSRLLPFYSFRARSHQVSRRQERRTTFPKQGLNVDEHNDRHGRTAGRQAPARNADGPEEG